jgi:hypothetical protein
LELDSRTTGTFGLRGNDKEKSANDKEKSGNDRGESANDKSESLESGKKFSHEEYYS